MPEQEYTGNCFVCVYGKGIKPECHSVESLDKAFNTVADRSGSFSPADRFSAVFEITREKPSGRFRFFDRRRLTFFVNPDRNGGGGDGSELDPWCGMHTAVKQLSILSQQRKLSLHDGQRIRIINREMFAATGLEKKRTWAMLPHGFSSAVLSLR